MKQIIWSIKDIVDIIGDRKKNEFDSNLAVTGDRGNGKSTLIGKIFYRIKGFKPWKHQVYTREEVIKLLKTQQFGQCWDDETINSGYKRDWQKGGQQEFIKILVAFRDNYNTYASAIPNFFSLDKDLRDLYFIHLHVIERGLAIVHMPLQGRLYSQDRWDAKYNAKLEEGWSKKMKNNANFRPPFHKLTTFRGYLYFTDMTAKQKVLYKEIKKFKKSQSFLTEDEKKEDKELAYIQKAYNLLIEGKLSKEGLMQSCLVEGKKYSTICTQLNIMLKDNGIRKTMTDFLLHLRDKSIHSKETDQINDLIPEIS